VLYQRQNGINKVIAYASRSLKNSEKNTFSAQKLEYIAFNWLITDKFHDYLYGTTFEVVTDNNPVTYVTTIVQVRDGWLPYQITNFQ
jgi:hypothetical protein